MPAKDDGYKSTPSESLGFPEDSEDYEARTINDAVGMPAQDDGQFFATRSSIKLHTLQIHNLSIVFIVSLTHNVEIVKLAVICLFNRSCQR